jgi:tight adherence protein B
MEPLFIAVAVFLLVVLFVLGLYYFIWVMPENARNKRIKNRLWEISEPAGMDATASIDLLKKDEMSDVAALNRLLTQWSQSNRLHRLLRQADIKLNVSTFFLLTLIFLVSGYLASQLLLPIPLLNAAIGLALACLPLMFVLYKRKKRFRKFEALFPEALDLLTRAVKAGHAFNTGIEMIAQEMQDPVAKEFRIAFDEQNFGLPLKQALLNMVDRMPLVDLKFFVTAVLMQKETGGNLAEILTNLSYLIRERFKIMGEIRTFSAQGRLTGYILTMVPIIMGVVLSVISWNYIQPLFYTKVGHYMLAVAAFGQVIGYVVIRKIVNIKI